MKMGNCMQQDYLPPGIEEQAHEAIQAILNGDGLSHDHLETIQFCIRVCPPSFERAYRLFVQSAPTGDATGREQSVGDSVMFERDHHLGD